MEQVAQVKPHRSLWRTGWLVIVLGLLCISAGAIGGRILIWTAMATLTTPLTLIATVAMLLLPGLALLRLFFPGALAPIERGLVAIGLSSAIFPVLLLLGQLIGLRWNTWLCWGFLALSALVLGWPRHRDRQSGTDPEINTHQSLAREHVLLLGITIATIATRLYVTRDLPAGLWGDSYHHTMIAQLLVDNGGLFSSWRPYAPLKTFTYHFGFHSNIAWLHWLSGEPVATGLLIIGQTQNALAAPLAYLITWRLLGSRRAGVWAALLTGFASVMPAYYVNWGRYTQLAGQTSLPTACVTWMALLEASHQSQGWNSRLRLIGLAAIVTAGLALTHYRVALFAACFVLAYAIYLTLAAVRSPATIARIAGLGLAAGSLGLLAIVPWLIRLREGPLLRIGGYFLSNNVGTGEFNILEPADVIFSRYAPLYLVVPALLGVALLAWRRQWRGLVLPGWAVIVWVAANPYLIGLTGAGIISNFTVLIAAYLVLAPLAAAAIEGLCAQLARIPGSAKIVAGGQLLAGAVVLLWGLSWQQRIVEPEFQLFTPADAAAMEWIRRETPSDAKFFVNSFAAYGGGIMAGSDGGWWLPFVSGRQTNLPPFIHGTEAGEQPNYQAVVLAENRAIQQYPLNSAEAAEALHNAGYSYLYDGPAAQPPGEYISPEALAQSPMYALVYNHDGVRIWSIR